MNADDLPHLGVALELRLPNNEPMNTLSITVPESLASLFGEPGVQGREILVAAVVKWYELGRISHGKAAEILDISRSEFLDLLSNYQVSPWQYTAEEIDRELALD